MKMNFKNIFATLAFAVLFSTASFAQSKQDTSMIVNGVCGMCKNTIETAAGKLEGLHDVSWNVETKVLQLSYDPEQLNLQQISDAINEAGYDTEYHTAPDEAYYALHKCCYYRDPQVIEDHKEKK